MSVEGRDLSERRTQEATKDTGIDDESSHPELCSEVADGVRLARRFEDLLAAESMTLG
jgi:hypothetical protein